MLLSKSGPTDNVRIPACRPVICRPAIPARREAGASQPQQVQHEEMLRPISQSVKLSLSRVPAVLHR